MPRKPKTPTKPKAPKKLSRPVYLALQRAGAPTAEPGKGRTVYVHYPPQGTLRAERMGLIECYTKDQWDACAYRRTAEGERLFQAAEVERQWWLKAKA